MCVWPYDKHIPGMDFLLQNTVIMQLDRRLKGKKRMVLTGSGSGIGKELVMLQCRGVRSYTENQAVVFEGGEE